MSLPGGGLFDGVKKFINGILIGYVALRLLPFLPKLLEILPVLVKVGDFLVDGILGILLDGFGTFLNGAYELRDKTIGFLKQVGGDGAVKAFEQFEGALDKVLMALIGVGAIMTFSGSNQGGRNSTRRGGSAGRRVAPAQRSAGTRFARNAAVRLFGRRGTKAGLKLLKNFISPVVKRIPIIGTFIDFVLNYFVFKEPLGKFTFAAIGSGVLGAIGVLDLVDLLV